MMCADLMVDHPIRFLDVVAVVGVFFVAFWLLTKQY